MNYATSGRYSFLKNTCPIIPASCEVKCTPEIGSTLSRPPKAYIFKVQALIETFSFFKPNFFFLIPTWEQQLFRSLFTQLCL